MNFHYWLWVCLEIVAKKLWFSRKIFPTWWRFYEHFQRAEIPASYLMNFWFIHLDFIGFSRDKKSKISSSFLQNFLIIYFISKLFLFLWFFWYLKLTDNLKIIICFSVSMFVCKMSPRYFYCLNKMCSNKNGK